MITDHDFISSLGPAFLARRLKRLSDGFVDDIQVFLSRHGIVAPARSLSMLLLLDETPGLGVTQIADRMGLSHPLAINVLSNLEGLGLAQFGGDPADRRRRLVFITAAGKTEAGRLRVLMPVIAGAYAALSRETGVDLARLADTLDSALAETSFLKRLDALLPEAV